MSITILTVPVHYEAAFRTSADPDTGNDSGNNTPCNHLSLWITSVGKDDGDVDFPWAIS